MKNYTLVVVFRCTEGQRNPAEIGAALVQLAGDLDRRISGHVFVVEDIPTVEVPPEERPSPENLSDVLATMRNGGYFLVRDWNAQKEDDCYLIWARYDEPHGKDGPPRGRPTKIAVPEAVALQAATLVARLTDPGEIERKTKLYGNLATRQVYRYVPEDSAAAPSTDAATGGAAGAGRSRND